MIALVTRYLLIISALIFQVGFAAAQDSQTLRIGVLSYRPVEVTRAQWEPLRVNLETALHGLHVEILPMSLSDVDTATKKDALDFILTNPEHFILLKNRYGASAAATIVPKFQGRPFAEFAGVIFTRADRSEINTLAEVENKTVAAMEEGSLGGYLMQRWELEKNGIKGVRYKFTGMPQDRVIDAVLSKQADVGFVRSGVLESMAAEGKLRLDAVKVINLLSTEDFPLLHSTDLYPEWPFVVSRHVKPEIARAVTVALLSIKDTDQAARTAQIAGFTTPSDYTSVETLMLRLKTHPNELKHFTLSDVISRYHYPVSAGLAVVLTVLLMGGLLIRTNRRLHNTSFRNSQLMADLDASKNLYHGLFEHMKSGVAVYEAVDDGNEFIFRDFNHAAELMEGISRERVVGKRLNEMFPGVKEFGLFNVLQRVWKTGQPESLLFSFYHDDRIQGWRNNYVYRLGTGEVVAIYDDVSKQKEAETRIWNQANYDPLTSLPNRILFQDRLEQEIRKAQRDDSRIALLFIDLDRFKEINDTLGHDIGDILLIEAATRIKECVRDSDTVARLGGDEFTVILPDLRDLPQDINRIATNIINSLSEPYELKGNEGFLSASVGIAIFPEDANNMSDLIKHADQSMYAAKNYGRGRYQFFTTALQEASQLRMRLTTDLRHALNAGQFEVYYQPIIDLDSGHIRKAEALLRWNHPEHGFISPATFIPIAEETGTILEIGDWVFTQAVQQVKRCQSGKESSFQISVNESPVQFMGGASSQKHWVDHLQAVGLSGSSIAVEITEGLLMDSDPNVTDKLLRFRDAGIQVAIDDFGTGYSALSYLKKFHIDYLKIDQSFIKNLAPDSNDLALCEAIVVMAHKLGLKVIAEGVETEMQYQQLKLIGCDFGQGYLFCRPVPSVEFEKFLAES